MKSSLIQRGEKRKERNKQNRGKNVTGKSERD